MNDWPEISQRDLLGATAGIATGAGMGLMPGIVLAQANTEAASAGATDSDVLWPHGIHGRSQSGRRSAW